MRALASRPIREAAFRPSKGTPVKASVIKDGPQRWYHVCSVADETRNGHAITEAELRAYVQDFYTGPEAGPVYLGHQDAERRPGTPEPPAAGWVLAMELTDSGELWALYEMTDDLYREIKRGGYRYNSICGRFLADDDGAVTGAEFWSIAVTNTPAVVGLTPMAASRRPQPQEGRIMAMSVKDALKQALKELPDDASREQTLQFIDAVLAQQEAVEGGGESEAPAPDAEVCAASDAPEAPPVALEEGGGAMADSAVAMIAEAAGTDAAAVIAAIQEDPAAFAALVTGAGDAAGPNTEEVFSDVKAAATARVAALSKQLSSKDAELTALSQRVEQLEAERREREVDEAIDRGLFTGAERERLVRLARNAPEEWGYWLTSAEAAPAVPTGRIVQASKPRGAGFDGLDSPRAQMFERVLASVIKDPAKRKEVIREKLAATDRD